MKIVETDNQNRDKTNKNSLSSYDLVKHIKTNETVPLIKR